MRCLFICATPIVGVIVFYVGTGLKGLEHLCVTNRSQSWSAKVIGAGALVGGVNNDMVINNDICTTYWNWKCYDRFFLGGDDNDFYSHVG